MEGMRPTALRLLFPPGEPSSQCGRGGGGDLDESLLSSENDAPPEEADGEEDEEIW